MAASEGCYIFLKSQNLLLVLMDSLQTVCGLLKDCENMGCAFFLILWYLVR